MAAGKHTGPHTFDHPPMGQMCPKCGHPIQQHTKTCCAATHPTGLKCGCTGHYPLAEETGVLLIGDQPVTCPHDGSRTDWTDGPDGSQRHTCLAHGHTFTAAPDPDGQPGSNELKVMPDHFSDFCGCDSCEAIRQGDPQAYTEARHTLPLVADRGMPVLNWEDAWESVAGQFVPVMNVDNQRLAKRAFQLGYQAGQSDTRDELDPHGYTDQDAAGEQDEVAHV